MKGAKAIMGAKPARAANDRYNGFPVSIVIHQTITNCTIDEPSNESCCPKRKDKYCLNVFSVVTVSMGKLFFLRQFSRHILIDF